MGKLRVTHLEYNGTQYALRFSGETPMFEQVRDQLKALGRSRARWEPDYPWPNGKWGAWRIGSDALEALAPSFFNLHVAMHDAQARFQAEPAEGQAGRREREAEYRRQAEARHFHHVPLQVQGAYQTLDLSVTTDREAIKRAYRRLAVLHHPDKFMLADALTRERHEQTFKKVNQARDIIMKWLETGQRRSSSQTA